MLGNTHMSFGLASASVAVYFTPYLTPLDFLDPIEIFLFYMFCLLGSIFPDIDEPQSKIGRKTLGASNLIKTFFGHRGLTHSLICFAALGLFLGILGYFLIVSDSLNQILVNGINSYILTNNLSKEPLISHLASQSIIICICGFLFGWLSHLVGDMMTLSGVPLLLPFNAQKYFVLPQFLRFKTGGKIEHIIHWFSCATFIWVTGKIFGVDNVFAKILNF